MANQLKVTLHRSLVAVLVLVTALFAVQPAAASDTVTLNGSFVYVFQRPAVLSGSLSSCPSGVADICGLIQLDGLGAADWTWVNNHTYVPTDGRGCFSGTASFTLTLESDGSTISGPTTSVFCNYISDSGAQHAYPFSWGWPFVDDETIQLANGTGQFAGLQGTAILHVSTAGASYRGSLNGTLGN